MHCLGSVEAQLVLQGWVVFEGAGEGSGCATRKSGTLLGLLCAASHMGFVV